MKRIAIVLGLLLCASVQAAGPLNTSVLPTSRSIQTSSMATFSVAYVNGGAETLTNCQTTLNSSIPATLSSLDLSGNPLAPFTLGGFQSRNLTLAIAPTAPFTTQAVYFNFICLGPSSEQVKAPDLPGVNAVLMSASDTPPADVIASAATASGDGIVNANPSAAFAVGTTNVGSSATITASANTATKALPVSLTICQTNSVTGACINPPVPAATATANIANGATPTFAVFVTSTGTISLDPANNRIFVVFEDATQVVRGATSVAITSSVAQPSPPPSGFLITPGTWRDSKREVCFNVATTGDRLTTLGSSCENGKSIDIELENLRTNFGSKCDAEVDTHEEIQIVNNSFQYIEDDSDESEAVSAVFTSANTNSGTAVELRSSTGAICQGTWTDAVPQ